MADDEQRLLLLIDEEPSQSRLIASAAAREGWRTLIIRDPGSAVSMLTRRDDNDPGAVCLDLSISGDDGGIIIAELRSRRPTMPLVVLVDRNQTARGVEALRAGATDYLLKPVMPDPLNQALRAAARRQTWGDELAVLSEKEVTTGDFSAMIGTAPAFCSAVAIAARNARGQTPLLIEGESGTGKEQLLRAIHASSARSAAPLRIVNAGCYAPKTIESVLFGHEKDSFPGAFDQRTGVLQQCDGGTVVIDEIECLSPHVQARLLEFIQRGAVRPIGAQYSYRSDVRLIAASDTALRERVNAGLFHLDLLSALSGVTVTLPPLRERLCDIAALTEQFLTANAECAGLSRIDISAEALALLATYEWPRNVRQLKSTLMRAAIFSEGDTLEPADFPTLSGQRSAIAEVPPMALVPVSSTRPEIPLYTHDGNLRPLDEIEGDVIRLAISLYRGRMTEVARRLGIGRSTLYRKLSELGIDNAA